MIDYSFNPFVTYILTQGENFESYRILEVFNVLDTALEQMKIIAREMGGEFEVIDEDECIKYIYSRSGMILQLKTYIPTIEC